MLTKQSSLLNHQSTEPFVLSLKEVNKSNVALAGDKGASLGELLQAGIAVPPGFVITTAAYQEFMRKNRLHEVVKGLLAQVSIEDTDALEHAAEQIQNIFLFSPIPPSIQKAIEDAYLRLGQGPVAVRSSATAEDLPQASFAGQQSTFLYVEGIEQVTRAVLACWASLFEARAVFYRETNGFDHPEVGIAVRVQLMVDAEVSGVLFTADPTTGSRDILLLEAVYGLGEPLVSGQLSPDVCTVDRASLQITEYQVAPQPWALQQNRETNGWGRGATRRQLAASRQRLPKLSRQHVQELGRLGLEIERHYGYPQDIEWAIAGGQVYILQSRPVTTLKTSRREVGDRIAPGPHGERAPLLSGSPASPGIGAGRVCLIQNASQMHLVQAGDVLVTQMTSPDLVPAMKRAAAIVTDRGGRTCHAAIVSREMGIPCVVGTGNATEVLSTVPMVTVDGGAGKVYEGNSWAKVLPDQRSAGPAHRLKTNTRVYVNLADPEAAARVAAMDVDGVGLLRAEFIIAHIGEHPRAMLESGRGGEFTARLAQGMEAFARAFSPRPVVYRFSDFKTNEYRNLKGGEAYEVDEENPMLGYRGCARYLAEPDLFNLEVAAVQQVRERFPNLWVMLPFVRTVEELREIKWMLGARGLQRSQDFKLWMMLEVPSNVLLLDEFLDVGVDGISIGSNDLTQLVLGVDRDSERLASVFDERNPAVLRALGGVIKMCSARGVTVSICGQAPSVYPELTRRLVSWGISSVSVSPDMIQQTRSIIHAAETNGFKRG